MIDRDETVEMAVMSRARSGSGPRACLLQHVKATDGENAREHGHIRGRSRSTMTGPG